MKLIACHVENFGKLHQMDFSFSEGVHVICEENGWGKSTLASFLKVMFYGFKNERARDDYSNERKRFRPWQGGVYGGSVTFSVGKKTYLLTRIFGMKEKEDVFSLKDAVTNLDSEDYTSNIGEELFQIDRTSFEKTVFLSQNACETKATGNIHAKIGDLAESMDDINQYEKAEHRLNDWLNVNSPTRKTGILYKMKDDMTRLEMKIKTGGSPRENMSRLSDTLYRQFLERKETKARMRSYFGPEIPSEEDVLAYLDLSSRWKAMKEEHLSSQNREEKDNRKNWIFLFPGFVFLIAGLILSLKSFVGVISFVAGIAMIGLFLMKFLHGRTKEQEDFEDQKEDSIFLRNKIDSFLENLGFEPEEDCYSQFLTILNRLREYKNAYQECEKARIRMDQFELEYEQEKKAWCGEQKKEREDLKEQYEKLSEKYDRVKMARDYLEKAKEAFTTRYQNPLMHGFLKYYHLLTGKEGDSYVIDGNIDVLVKEHGLLRESRYLSAGSKDLTGICMRMALVDAMYEKEKPFLILDDPFVNLDAKKTERGLKFLDSVGKEYQILYFTCHESRIK